MDYSLKHMIDKYESRYGEINSNTKYHKKNFLNIFSYYRSCHVLDRILDSSHNKIAVVYGSMHISDIKFELHWFHHYTKLDKKLLDKYR